MGVQVAAQVDKKCYKNQTAGWLGVVLLDHLGAREGHSVEPYGTVYLSDEEALLTARAPTDPKNNPFVAKTYMFVESDTGRHVEREMKPLVLITDDRELPDPHERFVPGLSEAPTQHISHDASVAAARADTAAALAREDDREVATAAVEPEHLPASSAAVDPALARPWSQPPADLSETPKPGHLSGTDAKSGPSDEDAAAQGGKTGAPPQQPAPTSVASSSQHGEPNASESSGTGKANGGAVEQGGEEHAAQTASGEETGAAATPGGQAPQGEFAQHEEVGDPAAPRESQK